MSDHSSWTQMLNTKHIILEAVKNIQYIQSFPYNERRLVMRLKREQRISLLLLNLCCKTWQHLSMNKLGLYSRARVSKVCVRCHWVLWHTYRRTTGCSQWPFLPVPPRCPHFRSHKIQNGGTWLSQEEATGVAIPTYQVSRRINSL